MLITAALRRAVDALHRRRAHAGDARDVDDRAAAVARARVLDERACDVEIALRLTSNVLSIAASGVSIMRTEVRVRRALLTTPSTRPNCIDRAREHRVDVLGLPV
jgi:hypothetical protein